MYLSASKISNALKCGWKLYISQNDKLSKIYFEKGKYIHGLLANVFRGKTDKLKEDEINYVAEVLEKLQDRLVIYDNPDIQIIEKEQATNFQLTNDTILWVPDLLQIKGNNAIITDWKTGQRVYPQKEVENDIQAKIYAYMLLEGASKIVDNSGKEISVPDVKRVFFNFAFTETGVVKQVIYQEKDIDKLRQEIIYAIKLYKDITLSMNYQPNIGAWCNYCEFKKVCSNNIFWKDNKKVDIPINDEEWVKLYNQWYITSKYLDEVKDVLDTYAKQNDLKKVDNIEVKLTPVQKISFSKSKKAQAYLKENYPDFFVEKFDEKKFKDANPDEILKLIEQGIVKDSSYQTVKYKIISED